MPRLSELAARLGSGARVAGDAETIVTGVTHDSRAVRPGALFAALPGERVHGRDFVPAALAAGAAAVLADRPVDGAPTLVARDPRGALGEAAAAIYGDPTAELALAGVTGTNGKTTTTYLVEAALARAGHRPGVMGTVEYRCGDRRWDARHTTPEAPVIQRVAREMCDAGASHLVLEVSSHALALDRHRGCRFDVVAFTNLTQDHLDFHETMEAYAAAKLRLFTDALDETPGARAVVNADDPFAETILARLERPAIRVSCRPESRAHVRPAAAPRFDIDGVAARLVTPAGRLELRSPLLGEHNLANLLMAFGIAVQLGIEPARALEGLGRVAAVPGRLERVSGPGGPAVLVDYAHTPDALARAVAAVAPLTPGRLVCVFGCGGDRDRTKRPRMGEAAARRAAVCVVTSDNPRTEDPHAIIEMIRPGVEGAGCPPIDSLQLAAAARGYAVIPDRATAIRAAIAAAGPDDTVMIAGKGHEDYQILGTERIHFDDREQARAALRGGAGRADG